MMGGYGISRLKSEDFDEEKQKELDKEFVELARVRYEEIKALDGIHVANGFARLWLNKSPEERNGIVKLWKKEDEEERS